MQIATHFLDSNSMLLTAGVVSCCVFIASCICWSAVRKPSSIVFMRRFFVLFISFVYTVFVACRDWSNSCELFAIAGSRIIRRLLLSAVPVSPHDVVSAMFANGFSGISNAEHPVSSRMLMPHVARKYFFIICFHCNLFLVGMG